MKSTPEGWPRLSPAIYYDDVPAAIGWLCRAFGFEVRIKVEGEGGAIIHSELTYGEAVVMPAQSGANPHRPGLPPGASPRSPGGANTQSLFLYVDDVQIHHDRAAAAGARIISELQVNDYGPDYWTDRTYAALDPEDHLWWFSERLRSPAGR
jgi:uncharacterized glyoxalase superfamily protein PhnB